MSNATATASHLHTAQAGADIRHFLLRRLHSLTGILFGGYIIVHLLVNASLVEGARHDGQPSVFQVQVDKIHSLPFLPVIETVFIYLPILFHTVYGIWITVTGKPNVANYPFGKNWFYVLQRASAMVLVFFILFHILGMKGVFGGDVGRALAFEPLRATETTVAHMNAGWWVGWVVYPIGILAACYHLANGFWAAAITWGLTISRDAQKRWGLVCAGLFVLTFGSGMIALISALRAAPPAVSPAPAPTPAAALTTPTQPQRVEVRVTSAVDWKPLEVGAKVFMDSQMLWTEVPQPLVGRSFTCAASHYQGKIDFTVTRPGPLMMACTQNWGGGGNASGGWKQELSSRSDLELKGWKEIAVLLAMDKEKPSHWVVFSRDCSENEQFSVRTEKYASPILIR